jgi:hypothetical protein
VSGGFAPAGGFQRRQQALCVPGCGFYLARPAEDPTGTYVCVIIASLKDETGWGTACSGAASYSGWVVAGEVRGVHAKVVTDGYDLADELASGWEQLGGNVLVQVP